MIFFAKNQVEYYVKENNVKLGKLEKDLDKGEGFFKCKIIEEEPKNTVRGNINFSIDIECPFCESDIDLISDCCYIENPEIYSLESKTNLGIEFNCPNCNEELELFSIIY